MTFKREDFNELPIAPPGELCWECLTLLLGYLKLMPQPESLSRLVELMNMARTMKHGEFHPMIEQLFNEANAKKGLP